MPTRDRRRTADALATLQRLIEEMEVLGREAEDAAARVTQALGGKLRASSNPEQQQLLAAIGDVIDVVSERSRLAHQAYRLISDIRHREGEGLRAITEPPRDSR